jgi:hypothetical protein
VFSEYPDLGFIASKSEEPGIFAILTTYGKVVSSADANRGQGCMGVEGSSEFEGIHKDDERKSFPAVPVVIAVFLSGKEIQRHRREVWELC